MASKARAVKSAIKPAKPKPKAKGFSVTGLAAAAKKGVSAVQKYLPGYTTKAAARSAMAGFGKKVSAKRMLKKAYERKAKAQIRIGNLGQARRLLRKKATVV